MTEDRDTVNQSENGGGRRPSAGERRERFEERQAEKTRREIGRFHKRDFVYVALLSALILIAVLILLDMRNLRGGNDVKVIIPPTAAATVGATSGGTSAAAPVERAAEREMSAGELVNINTATADELKTLPGIGDKRATDIIEYRNSHGAFPDIQSVTEVPGIGESLFGQIKDKITV